MVSAPRTRPGTSNAPAGLQGPVHAPRLDLAPLLGLTSLPPTLSVIGTEAAEWEVSQQLARAGRDRTHV